MKKELTSRELQEVSKGILAKFDELCREHGLKYSIAYGTLIGAARHGGFIPWDDDIDVAMPREDYEKLLALQYDDGRFEVKSYRYSKGYYYFFSKMIDKTTTLVEHYRVERGMGVFIDIFPMDYFHDADAYERDHAKRAKELNTLMRNGFKIDKRTTPSLSRRIIRRGLRLAALPVRKRLLWKREHQHIMPADQIPAAKMMAYTYSYGIRDKHPKEIWDHLIRMKFEDIEVNAFEDYDSVLTTTYRNWRKLPPVEKRVPVHDFEAYMN